jgi:predicted O-methyltransferase YrrM
VSKIRFLTVCLYKIKQKFKCLSASFLQSGNYIYTFATVKKHKTVMHFISQALEDYAALHSENEPELLAQLDKETHQKVLQPRMLSGHFQGRFLSLISKLTNPKNILEIGTFTGYATLCLAEGLQSDGILDTIDVNEELYDFQRKYLDKSLYGEQIIQHVGSALDIIPQLDKRYDLVFIDADKKNYINYFQLIVPKVNKGGIILSDNVLWSGKVLEEIKPNDKSTIEIDHYNKLLKQDPRVETVLLPIRDGLTISRVK